MTQRSIQAGKTPTVIIRAASDVEVEGREDERVVVRVERHRGLEIGQGSESEIGRLRARVGDRVLLDIAFNGIGRKKQEDPNAIQVKMGGSGKVYVPGGSTVKVYAGSNVMVQNLRGSVTVSAGGSVQLRRVHALVHASAGRGLDVDCETLAAEDVKCTSGRDLRFYIHDLSDTKIAVNDLGGYWEGVIGTGQRKVRLNAGGDVTLVTRQEVKGQPPDYTLGNIESPGDQADG